MDQLHKRKNRDVRTALRGIDKLYDEIMAENETGRVKTGIISNNPPTKEEIEAEKAKKLQTIKSGKIITK